MEVRGLVQSVQFHSNGNVRSSEKLKLIGTPNADYARWSDVHCSFQGCIVVLPLCANSQVTATIRQGLSSLFFKSQIT